MVSETSTSDPQIAVPLNQPAKKSKHKYLSPTETEQLLILAQCCNQIQASVLGLSRHGKFAYSSGEKPQPINIEALHLCVADLLSVLKLALEAGTLDRTILKKLTKIRLLLMLENSKFQGAPSPGRITDLHKKLI